ncbi:hypothetical protein PIB30_020092 [Stylosanthes scabra]|uniref:Uncharacterized protein n=1 Tax=Stylosanthes scabra TaxID=79078 RepID=A0ABU6W6Q4_9FABA|nr:hypothetical protein [Stylosanthes scabra]
MSTFSSDTCLVALKLCCFFGGKTNVTVSFTGMTGVYVRIALLDCDVGRLIEARVERRCNLVFPLTRESDLMRAICNECTYQTVQDNKLLLREEPRSLLPDEPKAQPPRASAGTGWGVYLQGTPIPKSVRVLAGGKWWKLDVTPPCVAPSRVSSRGVSEVDTVPCQLHKSASELQGCPTSRNLSYTGREVVLRGLGLQSWAYWAAVSSSSHSAPSSFSIIVALLQRVGLSCFRCCYQLHHHRCHIVVSIARKFIRVLPEVIPESCKWVDSDVLGAKSDVGDEFVNSFYEHYSSCVSDVEGSRYRVVAPDPEYRVCHVDIKSESCIFVYEAIFTEGFIRGFEVICREFGIPTFLGVFHHLFKLTKPFSKEKQQWLSFRANQNMKVFEMLKESVRDFKCLYFKVVAQPRTSSFLVDGEGEYRFPLSWNETWVNPQVSREELSESELLFVDMLSDCWGKKTHLQTRQLLTQSSTYIQKEILGVMSGKSSIYDKFKSHLLSKSKKPTNMVGTASGSSKPTSSDQSIPTSSDVVDSSSARNASATPSPSIQSAPEVDKVVKEPSQSLKRKAPEPKFGHINSKEFDHTRFVPEYLLGGNTRIPMDGENFIKNLEAMTRSSIKAAAICQVATNKLKGNVLVPEGEVGKLRDRVKVVEAEKRVIEGPQLCKEQLKKVEKEKSNIEEKYKRLYAEYKLKVEDNQRLEADLQVAQDTCDKFSSDAMLLAEEVANNLKEQIMVLLPDFDTDQIGQDHKVNDVIIVPPEPPTEEQPDPKEEEITLKPISVVMPTSDVAPTSENMPLSGNSPEVQPTMSDPPPTPPSLMSCFVV